MPFSSFYHVNEIQSFEMATTVGIVFHEERVTAISDPW